MVTLTQDRANFSCPACDSSAIFREVDRDGIYRCKECGGRTHELIEANRDDIEELASDDVPAARLASLLAGDGE